MVEQGEKLGPDKAGMNVGAGFSFHYRDPLLTDCGVHQSQKNGEQLRKALAERQWYPEKVIASTLTRTIETAEAMFP